MVVKSKAQSALEFLTTYGWAFLVILIMIAALSYFGVLDPSKYLPDKCQTSSGIGCTESIMIQTVRDGFYEYSAVVFYLKNNRGLDVAITRVNGSIGGTAGCNWPDQSWVLITNASLDPGDLSQYWSNGDVGGQTALGASFFPFAWKSNEILQFVIVCYDENYAFSDGDRPSAEIVVDYSESGSSYERSFLVSVSGNVEG